MDRCRRRRRVHIVVDVVVLLCYSLQILAGFRFSGLAQLLQLGHGIGWSCGDSR